MPVSWHIFKYKKKEDIKNRLKAITRYQNWYKIKPAANRAIKMAIGKKKKVQEKDQDQKKEKVIYSLPVSFFKGLKPVWNQ